MLKYAALFLASVALSPAGMACSCMPSSRVDMIARSEAAFEGRVLRVWREGDPNTGSVVARVKILKAIKGVKRRKNITLFTGANSAMCGIGLERGQIISVAASKVSRATFSTGLCSILPP